MEARFVAGGEGGVNFLFLLIKNTFSVKTTY